VYLGILPFCTWSWGLELNLKVLSTEWAYFSYSPWSNQVIQCQTPVQSSWKSPTFFKFVYNPNKSTLTSSNDPNKSTLTSPRVLNIFFSSISMGRKGKTEIGTEVGKGVKKNPTQIWPYLSGILLTPSPTSPPNYLDESARRSYIHNPVSFCFV